jgi:hypothetical protein
MTLFLQAMSRGSLLQPIGQRTCGFRNLGPQSSLERAARSPKSEPFGVGPLQSNKEKSEKEKSEFREE